MAAALAARPRLAAAALVGASLLVAGAAGLAGGLDAVGGSRMTLASPDRANEAGAAVRVGADHPLTGAGPGQVVLSWRDGDGRRLVAHYAHNEYLQIWAELGAIGVALVLVLLAAVAREIKRAGVSPIRAAAGAGLAAVALHSGMDFLWHVPAIPLVCAALVAVACPPRRGALRRGDFACPAWPSASWAAPSPASSPPSSWPGRGLATRLAAGRDGAGDRPGQQLVLRRHQGQGRPARYPHTAYAVNTLPGVPYRLVLGLGSPGKACEAIAQWVNPARRVRRRERSHRPGHGHRAPRHTPGTTFTVE